MSGGPVVPDHKVYIEKKLYDEGVFLTLGVILPEPNQLLLDYDSPELPSFFEDRMKILLQAVNTAVRYQTFESRHGNRHVIITCNNKTFTDIERIAWQAALGSDSKREALSLLSVAKNSKNPSLLIQRKDASDLLATISLDTWSEEGRKFRV